MASVAASQPPFSLAQYGGASNDRELCLQNCREWVTPFAWGWRRGGGYNYQYARCVQDCESRFWKDFDRKMEQLEDN
jgi:hypothetical protein